jgi:hypothetical protein
MNYGNNTSINDLSKNKYLQMNPRINIDIPSSFSPKSKVWIYQINRPLLDNEYALANQMIQEFVSQWTSHGSKVKGFGTILFNHFLILIADETASSVSGCSTDSSVRLIKEIEKKIDVSLFDRQKLAFQVSNEILLIPLSELNIALNNGIISNDTFYFNNLISHLEDLHENWIIRLDQSWLATKYGIKNSVSSIN